MSCVVLFSNKVEIDADQKNAFELRSRVEEAWWLWMGKGIWLSVELWEQMREDWEVVNRNLAPKAVWLEVSRTRALACARWDEIEERREGKIIIFCLISHRTSKKMFHVSSFHLNAFPMPPQFISTLLYGTRSSSFWDDCEPENLWILSYYLSKDAQIVIHLKWYKREREKALHFVNWIHRLDGTPTKLERAPSSTDDDDTEIWDDDGRATRRGEGEKKLKNVYDSPRYNLRWLWKLLSFQDFVRSGGELKWGNERYRIHTNIDNQQSAEGWLTVGWSFMAQFCVHVTAINRLDPLTEKLKQSASLGEIKSTFHFLHRSILHTAQQHVRDEKKGSYVNDQRMIDMIEFDLVSTIF